MMTLRKCSWFASRGETISLRQVPFLVWLGDNVVVQGGVGLRRAAAPDPADPDDNGVDGKRAPSEEGVVSMAI